MATIRGCLLLVCALAVSWTALPGQEASEQKQLLFEKVDRHFGGDLSGKHFAIWGLAFKPKTDDMREAPALVLIEALLESGATVTAFDPEASEEAKRRLGDRIVYADSAMSALEGADALVLRYRTCH